MAETVAAQMFVDKHGRGSKYRLTYRNQHGMPLWWNADKMSFSPESNDATLFDWDDIQKHGNIAKRYMLLETELMIDPYTLTL